MFLKQLSNSLSRLEVQSVEKETVKESIRAGVTVDENRKRWREKAGSLFLCWVLMKISDGEVCNGTLGCATSVQQCVCSSSFRYPQESYKSSLIAKLYSMVCTISLPFFFHFFHFFHFFLGIKELNLELNRNLIQFFIYYQNRT